MSGPITAGYFLVHGALMLSEHALREARAMHREFGEVRDQLLAREHEQARARRGRQEARLERIAVIRKRASLQGARLARLRSLAQALAASAPEVAARIPASMPATPAGDDDAEWTAFLGALDAAVRDLETLLAEAGGRLGERLRASAVTAARAPSIDDVLSAYALQRELQPGLDAAQTEQLRATAARVLGRLALPDGAVLPAELELLACEIVLAPSLDRAEALALELRRAVHRQREAAAMQDAEAGEARELLLALGDDAPAPLLRALEAVAAKVERLDAPLRASAQEGLAALGAARAQREQEVAAMVLEQSLRDLGYEVEEIESTLFAAGGTVHFRRPGWESYFVRLRVDPREQTVNFNVVRARGDEETAERRRLDALAEDRWCAEFPRLMRTLEARGLRLDVRRRLGAGEVPVQVVDGSGLPKSAADETSAGDLRAPQARSRP